MDMENEKSMDLLLSSIFILSTAAWVCYSRAFSPAKSSHTPPPTPPISLSKDISNIIPVNIKIPIKSSPAIPSPSTSPQTQTNRNSLGSIMERAQQLGDLGHVVLGVAGGSGSGKTTLAHAVAEALGKECITFISHDSYYRDISHLSMNQREKHNFDHPDALETSLLVEHVRKLKNNEPVCIPKYDYATHSRVKDVVSVKPKKVIIIEGILLFAYPELCAEMDIKIFVDTDDDIRLIRRMKRDIVERGRTVESVISQYLATVRPMHNEFVGPSKHRADIIVPVGVNSVALDLLVHRLHSVIEQPKRRSRRYSHAFDPAMFDVQEVIN